jgi:adenylate cyclase
VAAARPGSVKKYALRIALGLAVVVLLLFHVAERLRLPFLANVESIIYDTRLRLMMPRTLDPRIVVLDIDERSLLEREQGGEGRWPWSRDRMALLVDKLFEHYQVAVVGFDVVFAETDSSSGLGVLESLSERELKDVEPFQEIFSKIRPSLDYDRRFAESLQGRPVVLGFTFLVEDKHKGLLPAPVFSVSQFGASVPHVARFKGYAGNLPMLQEKAASGGHFNPLPDSDGITRRVPMLARYGDGLYEPLSVALVRLLYGSPALKAIVSEESAYAGYVELEALQLGSFRIPLDHEGAALVPFRGPSGSYAYHSLVDVLHERVPAADLKGKIVLVGATAPGLFDLRATPVDPVYPGVEIHANVIAGILDQTIAHTPAYALGAEFALILALGLALALWLPVLAPQQATLLTACVLLLVLLANLGLFHFAHLALPLAATLVMIVTLYTGNMAHGYFVVARERRQITGLFGQYVPREVVEKLAENPEQASMEGESREMTVLFTDVRGFTTISEGLEPRVLSQLMNEFLTPLTEVIYKHRGTIDKYMGDCIMAFWGAPLADPAHARNGVLAALEMQRRLKELQPYFTSRNWPPIAIGVGMNTGRMSVGNMGSRVRLAYTVMGDAVNAASRLEGLTREYGTDIIVGEETRAAVSGIVFREIDRVRVKGKDTAISIFEPLAPDGELSRPMRDELELFQEALALYRRQDWSAARQRLARLAEMAPGARLYGVFMERIDYLRANPPGADWDGTFTFQTK